MPDRDVSAALGSGDLNLRVAFVADTTVRFTVNVHDRDAIERVTGPGGDEWRSQFYGLRTTEQVIEHWIYNYLCNGVTDVSRLDGWADLAHGAVTFETEFSDLELVEPKEAHRG